MYEILICILYAAIIIIPFSLLSRYINTVWTAFILGMIAEGT